MAFEIETRLLRYVIAVAGEGNISRAAKKRVYVAAPSLARENRELETRLGYKLFNRHWRGVSLTPAGEAFIEEARKARSHILRAIERGAAASRGEAGRLVLGHSPCLQTKQLIQVERRFAEAAPSAKIEFRSAFGEPLLEWVLSEIVDAALVVLPIESDEIHSECIWKQPLVVALPEDWSLATMPIVSLAGLSEMPSIWPAKSLYPSFYEWMKGSCQRGGCVLQIVREASTYDELLDAVGSGLGFGLVQQSLSLQLQMKGVVFRELSEPGLVVRTGVAYRTGASWCNLNVLLQVLRCLSNCEDDSPARMPPD
jgi:DNA-binding transcriptional LysR family regulator